MRTALGALAALAALAVVVSCGGEEAAPTTPPAPTIAPPTPAIATPPPAATIAPTPPPAPTIAPPPQPAPTIAPTPTEVPPTPEPTPTPEPPTEPTQEQLAMRAAAIASEWAANNGETVAKLVVEVMLASPDVEERVPTLLRANLSGLLEAAVADELGNSLGVEVDSVAYHGDAVFSVTLVVAGTVAVGLGPVEAVDVTAPIIVTVDLDSEQATAWEADVEQADVTIR